MDNINKQMKTTLLHNKKYIVILLLLSFLTSFMYFFVRCSIDNNLNKVRTYYQNQNQEDFRFSLQGDNEHTLMNLEQEYQFYSEKRKMKKITEQGSVYYFINTPQKINFPIVMNGNLPKNKYEIAVFPEYLEQKKLKIGDTVKIDGEKLKITASVYLPDYQIFIPYDDTEQDLTKGTMFITSNDTIHEITGKAQVYYSAKYKSNPTMNEKRILSSKDITNYANKYDIKSESELEKSLESNKILAIVFLTCFLLITLFIYFVFLKKYFDMNRVDIGIYHALGFTDRDVSKAFLAFSLSISFIGSVLGLIIGYPASTVMINLYKQSFLFPSFEKSVAPITILIGVVLPVLLVLLFTYVIVIRFQKQETTNFLNNLSIESESWIERVIWKNTVKLPGNIGMSLRFVVRRWSSVFLLLLTVFITSVLFITSYSLYKSSGKLLELQTNGVDYRYSASFRVLQEKDLEDKNITKGIEKNVTILKDNERISTKILGVKSEVDHFKLLDEKNKVIDIQQTNGIIMNQALSEIYNIKIGDTVQIVLDSEKYQKKVIDICMNGDLNMIYTKKESLAKWLGIPGESYNVIFFKDKPQNANNLDAKVTGQEDKIKTLEKNSVSNRASAVIIQVLGAVFGCLLIYFVLLLNFQDSTRDIHILKLLDYSLDEIDRMILNVYKPLIPLFYLIVLPFSILVSNKIHHIISTQTKDYIPFTMDIFSALGVFVIVYTLYLIVHYLFKKGISRTI